jgi:hypothetical protein
VNLYLDVRKHAAGWAGGVYLGGWVRAVRAPRRFELVDGRRGVDLQSVEDVDDRDQPAGHQP